jgi:hypothetical protein
LVSLGQARLNSAELRQDDGAVEGSPREREGEQEEQGSDGGSGRHRVASALFI